MSRQNHIDLAILGGGLSGCLIALCLWKNRPELRIVLIEAEQDIGGNQIWSFFESDIAPEHRALLAPLVAYSWSSYDVRFPDHMRQVRSAYHAITSERLRDHVRSELPKEWILSGRRVLAATHDSISLDQGDKLLVGGVIDARGPGRLSELDLGWQKFVGREFLLNQPHGLDAPILMDATVEQLDGYRFVYCLPLSENRIFIEDTYYCDAPEIDTGRILSRITDYAEQHGWDIVDCLHEEQGALPVVMGGDFDVYWRSGGDNRAKIGLRAGLFHPTTSYSLPDAVRTAFHVAGLDHLKGDALEQQLHDHAHNVWRQRGFYRLLNRMLFRAARPAERYRIFERFYRLDRKLIGRFYAAESTLLDKLRILIGKPPVPVGRAISAIFGKRQ